MQRRSNTSGDFEIKSDKKKLWKRSFFYFFSAVGVLFLTGALALGGYMIYFYNFKKFPPPPDVSGIRPHLKNGDIILRSGIGFWSERFRESNQHDKRFSHVGIVLIDSDGKCQVIHAEGNDISGRGTVSVISLEKFVAESTEIGISRLHAADPDKFAAAAQKYLGRPFDWKFNTASSDDVYCTELVELSLHSLDPEIKLKHNSQNIIVPESCFDPRYFTEIPLKK